MGIARTLLGPFDEARLVRRCLNSDGGVMIDVGAHVGGTTLPFARSGWKVHAFEPDDANRAYLEQAVSEMGNVAVIPAAVSDQAGSQTLYRSEVSTGISALSAFHPSHRDVGEVEVVTLADYFEQKGIDTVDLLKIDTEGHDLFVLRGVPWDRVRPAAVVCEFEDRKTIPLGYTTQDLADMLTGQGYDVLVSEWYPVVEYGRRHRWRQIRRWPCELGDSDAWGNLIAVSHDLASQVMRAARSAAVRQRARDLVLRVLPSS